MANDNFFNSTFDDFFEDISSFSLPTPSWDPMSSFPAFNNHLGTLEPPLFPSAGSRSLSTAATFPPPPSAFFNGVSSSFGASSTAPQRTGPGSGFMSAGPAFPQPGASHPPAPTFEQSPSSRNLDRRPNPITNLPLNTSQPPLPLTLPPLPNNSWVPREATPPRREPNSDDFLNELLSRDFSSPSIPSQTPHRLSNVPNLPPPSNLAAGVRPLYRGATPGLRIPPVSRRDASALQASDNSELDPSNSIDFGLPEMSSHARSGRPKRVMRATELTLPESSGSSSRTINGLQPPQTRQSRRSSAASSPVNAKGKRKREESEGLFGEKELEVVDLVDKEEVPEDIRNEKPKNSIKLGAFQCVICMDDVTDLTVTYCGHLFCAECLHHALNIDATKRVCPICRQKIENRPANGKFLARAKGYFPLELKLTTKKNLRNLKG